MTLQAVGHTHTAPRPLAASRLPEEGVFQSFQENTETPSRWSITSTEKIQLWRSALKQLDRSQTEQTNKLNLMER